MEVQPNPDFEAVEEAIVCCIRLASPWSGEAYRSATPRYANSGDMVTGAGSGRLGGRWNPPGSFRTVYASLRPEAAMSESLAAFRYYGWALHDAMPRIFRAVAADFSLLLDLQRPDAEQLLAPWLEEIRTEDWRAMQRCGQESLSQAIGRAAFQAGLEGLLVPSFAAPGQVNLVAFPESFHEGSALWVRR